MDFFERVKAEVKKKKITIEALCQLVGISLASYNTLKRDKNLPRLDLVIAMSKALNVSLDYLAYGTEQQPPVAGIDDDLQPVVSGLQKLSKKRREPILGMFLLTVDAALKAQAEEDKPNASFA